MKYDNKLWHDARLIYTEYPLYFDPNENPWDSGKGYFIQHEDLKPWKGMPVFIKDFNMKKPESGKLLFTALGCIDIWINGKRVENDELKPGWSSYDKRTLYYEYDITDCLADGKNRILAVASNGWYSGRIVGSFYGSHSPAVMLCLTLKDESGEFAVSTDKTWKAKVGGQILNADIWDGEFRDGRADDFDVMSKADYDVSKWEDSEICDYFDGEVTKFIGPTVQVRKEMCMKPQSITVYEGTKDNGSDYGEINIVGKPDSFPITAGKDKKINIDFGQESVGWIKIKVRGTAGTKIKIRYSEMLNDSGKTDRGNDGPKGSVYSINYRSAKAKAYYVLNGKETEEYRPTFTFFGYRHIELSADGEFELLDCTAEVVGSVNPEIGHIETSDKVVNKLISNIIWGQRSNYLFVPTDCPQRDERLGWTGDTEAFSRTAAYNANVLGFFHKWLQDMRDSQSEAGAYPDVVPRVSCCTSENASAWSDAGIIVPYNMYLMYGDKSIIEEHYDSMERYIAQLVKINGMSGAEPRYGDWLAYDFCKNEFIASAYFIHDIDMMTEMSEAIGKPQRAEHYKELRKGAYEYFTENFMENGELKEHTQSTYVLALAFGLIDGDYAVKAAGDLIEKIKKNGNRLSTGFIGTCNLCPTLSKIGADNMAYTLLMQRNEPSWLYSVDQGATTIWERWNSYTLEKGFGDVGMNSFNHYAYGAIEEWMYRYMAGIEQSDVGFASLVLQPRVDTRTDSELPDSQQRMKWIKASYNSAAGLIESSWNNENGFTYECTVPNIPTVLMLPVFSDSVKINGVEHQISEFEAVGKCAKIKLAAGKYIFEQK
jgi:alpha-L-rhamnosidase